MVAPLKTFPSVKWEAFKSPDFHYVPTSKSGLLTLLNAGIIITTSPPPPFYHSHLSLSLSLTHSLSPSLFSLRPSLTLSHTHTLSTTATLLKIFFTWLLSPEFSRVPRESGMSCFGADLKNDSRLVNGLFYTRSIDIVSKIRKRSYVANLDKKEQEWVNNVNKVFSSTSLQVIIRLGPGDLQLQLKIQSFHFHSGAILQN